MTLRSRHVLLGAVLAAVIYAILETSALVGLRVLAATRGMVYQPIVTTALHPEQRAVLEDLLAGRADYLTYSTTLGWTIKPNGAFRSIYRANAQGLRGDREYALRPPARRLRIASFGDSFTHGDEVGNGDTWQRALENSDSSLEVLNFGVSGYGLDQALLRYLEDGTAYQAPVVLIGVMSENVRRSVSVFRPFYTQGNREPWTKPRFALRDSGLVLLENPMRSLAQYRELVDHPERTLPAVGAHDYYFHSRSLAGAFDVLPSVRLFKLAREQWLQRLRPMVRDGVYDESSEAYLVTIRTIDRFVSQARRNRAQPIIVVLPNQGDLRRFRRTGERIYLPLLQYLARQSYAYLDIMEGFATEGKANEVTELIPGHYSPLGNRLVAGQILRYLQDHGILGGKTDSRIKQGT